MELQEYIDKRFDLQGQLVNKMSDLIQLSTERIDTLAELVYIQNEIIKNLEERVNNLERKED